MNYYGTNDYRNYLAHYGRKGMKWHKHLPGVNPDGNNTNQPLRGNAKIAADYRQGAMFRRRAARMEMSAAARSKTGKERLDHENSARHLNTGVRNTTHWARKHENRAKQAQKRKANAGFTNWVKRMTGSKSSHSTGTRLRTRHRVG